MPTFFSAFPLLLLYMAIFSAAAELIPAVMSGAEQRSAIIRGLFDLDKRQGYYYCPAPRYTYGGCCYPNTYCVLASNGKIGCCPVGELCYGPAGDPISSTFTVTIHTTSTRTTAHTLTTSSLTTIEISVPTTPPLPTISPITIPSSISKASSTTPGQPALTPGLANNFSGATQNVGSFVAIIVCSFMFFIKVII
ncbi:hypothetical protein CVT25_008047 [Psilocybe cyanescens]|uniref:Granulins domain-containing protein n=1 Tax=Psilocybe cyanescens TaxID=93625 RepID=A0A409XG55_PSICY|nr:hypothetical protein CVT25_008047 [Psilocybe cyanescens]